MAATVAYVGSQGRNLFLRSIANRTIGVQSNGAAAATQIREFDIVTRNADGSIATIQRPFAEIDYKTSGGHDSYNSMQLSLTRRSMNGVTLNGQYTLGYSKGNTGGSNEAVTASNNARALADFDFDDGYNNFDIRHTFNLSLLYTLPWQGPLTGGWSIGGIANARSGLPVPVLITRNDIVYVDGAGNVWNNAAADRTAVINTPGGGQSRATRRPDLIAGVDPFIRDGGRIYLESGRVRDAEAGDVRQPRAQFDPRARVPPDRHGGVQASAERSRGERRTPDGSLQPVRLHELREPARDAPERAPRRGRERDAGQSRAAGPAVHGSGRRHVRHRQQHGGRDGGPRDEPSGAVRRARHFLISKTGDYEPALRRPAFPHVEGRVCTS
jgi:hypothetical protein